MLQVSSIFTLPEIAVSKEYPYLKYNTCNFWIGHFFSRHVIETYQKKFTGNKPTKIKIF